MARDSHSPAIPVSLRPATDAGAGASFLLDGSFEPGTLVLGEVEFAPLAPADYHLEFMNVGESVHATGRVQLVTRTVCVRCLEPFELLLDARVDELFYKEPTFDEHGEALPVIDDEGMIDLEPVLREPLLMAAPFKPLHDENCQGICPTCGANRNTDPCSCANAPDPNHPLAGLRDLIG